MKTNIFKFIFIACIVSLVLYVTITPIALYKALHKEQIRHITYELVEPGSELETFILANDSIDDVQ